MATLDDVRRLALWERPLRAQDVADVGEQGEVLGALVADEGVKHVLIADDPEVFFTTSHFNGHASVLIRLDAISEPELRGIVTEAWRLKAPKRLRYPGK